VFLNSSSTRNRTGLPIAASTRFHRDVRIELVAVLVLDDRDALATTEEMKLDVVPQREVGPFDALKHHSNASTPDGCVAANRLKALPKDTKIGSKRREAATQTSPGPAGSVSGLELRKRHRSGESCGCGVKHSHDLE
jgi:hypothetical protein